MSIKQLSVFLENEPGQLRKVTSILAKANINLRALSLADTADFGVLRLIVDNNDLALKILKENNFTVKPTQVVAVEMRDTPGGLDQVLEILQNININIEYMYAFMGAKPHKALVIFRVDDTDKAIDGLLANNINLISTDEQIADLIYYCWD